MILTAAAGWLGSGARFDGYVSEWGGSTQVDHPIKLRMDWRLREGKRVGPLLWWINEISYEP